MRSSTVQGTVLYGSDALAGTINIITNEPTFLDCRLALYGFNGFLSSNENGMRGNRHARVHGAGTPYGSGRGRASTTTRAASSRWKTRDPLFESVGCTTAHHHDNFGFNFGAFPEPFNTPYGRTAGEIPSSGANGNFITMSGLVVSASAGTGALPASPYG